jgi:hypothetical protein
MECANGAILGLVNYEGYQCWFIFPEKVLEKAPNILCPI